MNARHYPFFCVFEQHELQVSAFCWMVSPYQKMGLHPLVTIRHQTFLRLQNLRLNSRHHQGASTGAGNSAD